MISVRFGIFFNALVVFGLVISDIDVVEKGIELSCCFCCMVRLSGALLISFVVSLFVSISISSIVICSAVGISLSSGSSSDSLDEDDDDDEDSDEDEKSSVLLFFLLLLEAFFSRLVVCFEITAIMDNYAYLMDAFQIENIKTMVMRSNKEKTGLYAVL